jgi:hypothetical protein
MTSDNRCEFLKNDYLSSMKKDVSGYLFKKLTGIFPHTQAQIRDRGGSVCNGVESGDLIDPIFHKKFCNRIENDENDYIIGDSYEWTVWLIELICSHPVEVCVKDRSPGGKTYAKLLVRSPMLVELFKRYLGGVSRPMNGPFWSCLEFIQTAGIIDTGPGGFLEKSLGEDIYNNKIFTRRISALDGYRNCYRSRLEHYLGDNNVFNADMISNMAERASCGIPPRSKIVAIPSHAKIKTCKSLGKHLENNGFHLSDNATRLLLQNLRGFVNDDSYTDRDNPNYCVPLVFPNDIPGFDIASPVAFDVSGLSSTVVSCGGRTVPADIIRYLYENSTNVIFDLEEENAEFEWVFRYRVLSKLLSKFADLRDRCGPEFEELEAKFKAYPFLGDSCPGIDIEHFIPRNVLDAYSLNIHDKAWCFIMSRKNHSKLFHCCNDIGTLHKKRDIAIERGWWSKDEACEKISAMITVVKSLEIRVSNKNNDNRDRLSSRLETVFGY